MTDPYENIEYLPSEIKSKIEVYCIGPAERDSDVPPWLNLKTAKIIASLLKEVRDLQNVVDSLYSITRSPKPDKWVYEEVAATLEEWASLDHYLKQSKAKKAKEL